MLGGGQAELLVLSDELLDVRQQLLLLLLALQLQSFLQLLQSGDRCRKEKISFSKISQSICLTAKAWKQVFLLLGITSPVFPKVQNFRVSN